MCLLRVRMSICGAPERQCMSLGERVRGEVDARAARRGRGRRQRVRARRGARSPTTAGEVRLGEHGREQRDALRLYGRGDGVTITLCICGRGECGQRLL